MGSPTSVYSVDKLIEQARQLASDFKKMTGKPLPGVSNEIAEHDASKYLGLELCEDRTAGFDAKRTSNVGPKNVQIKARTIFNDNYRGQRLGQLKLDKSWDSVVLVLMDESYQAFEIFEATRDDIFDNLNDNTSRMKRGAMSVAKFRNIATLVWTKEDGLDSSAWLE
ncbi:MAG: hypothetical protein JKX87_04325 [Cycloclasticus sp.]|nr:hypothetical protein [Cycloclasticus sp.]